MFICLGGFGIPNNGAGNMQQMTQTQIQMMRQQQQNQHGMINQQQQVNYYYKSIENSICFQ